MPKKPKFNPTESLEAQEAIVVKLAEATGSLAAYTVDLLDRKPVGADPIRDEWTRQVALAVDRTETVLDALKEARAELGEALCRAVPFGTPFISFEGVRAMVPRGGGERVEWRNDLLESAVRPRVLMVPDEEDGSPTEEFRSPTEVYETFQSILSVNGSNTKVTGLRALGLDPDDYCHKVPKRADVQVTK